MKQVVISFDHTGKPYVVAKPKSVEVIFREPKQRSMRKKLKTLLYKWTV